MKNKEWANNLFRPICFGIRSNCSRSSSNCTRLKPKEYRPQGPILMNRLISLQISDSVY